MAMPGFTAEVSLYKTNRHYRQAPNESALGDRSATIYPQQACNVALVIDSLPLLLYCAHTWCFFGCMLGASECRGCSDWCIDWHTDFGGPVSTAIKANYRACGWLRF
jgi:hypothetical protein